MSAVLWMILAIFLVMLGCFIVVSSIFFGPAGIVILFVGAFVLGAGAVLADLVASGNPVNFATWFSCIVSDCAL